MSAHPSGTTLPLPSSARQPGPRASSAAPPPLVGGGKLLVPAGLIMHALGLLAPDKWRRELEKGQHPFLRVGHAGLRSTWVGRGLLSVQVGMKGTMRVALMSVGFALWVVRVRAPCLSTLLPLLQLLTYRSPCRSGAPRLTRTPTVPDSPALHKRLPCL